MSDDRDSGCSPETLLLLHSGEIDVRERADIEQHLRGCAACRATLSELQAALAAYEREPIVPVVDTDRYAAMVATAVASSPRSRASEPDTPGWSWRWAAVALLAFGAGVAATLLLLPVAPPAERAGAPAANVAAQLREGSAHDRLRAALASAIEQAPPAAVIDALLEALRDDPSTNVRLAVVDALRGRPLTPPQSAELLDAFAGQTQPLLRRSMIELYVALDLRKALPLLRTAQEGDPDTGVRERARWAIGELS